MGIYILPERCVYNNTVLLQLNDDDISIVKMVARSIVCRNWESSVTGCRQRYLTSWTESLYACAPFATPQPFAAYTYHSVHTNTDTVVYVLTIHTTHIHVGSELNFNLTEPHFYTSSREGVCSLHQVQEYKTQTHIKSATLTRIIHPSPTCATRNHENSNYQHSPSCFVVLSCNRIFKPHVPNNSQSTD